MTNEQQQVKDMMLAFQQECPEKPTIPDLETRKLRAKLIIEEALETIKGLGIQAFFDYNVNKGIGNWVFIETPDNPPNLKDILDGCEDLKVVTEGTLLACGLCVKSQFYANVNEDPHFNEVMRSNMSKMWTGKEVEARIGDADSFDSSGIIATNVYQDDDGNVYIYLDSKAPDKERPFVVKNKDGKFIKSPSYSPPNFNL